MNIYVASTINNFKQMNVKYTKESDTSISFIIGNKKHILHKGYYVLWTIKMEFLGIISSEFFKENFELGESAEIKVTFKDDSVKISKAGVFCFIKYNDGDEDG